MGDEPLSFRNGGKRASRWHQAPKTINNELYAEVLLWNRLRHIKAPNTGKRVLRLNPEDQWIRTEVPHLRIVLDDLWQGGENPADENRSADGGA